MNVTARDRVIKHEICTEYWSFKVSSPVLILTFLKNKGLLASSAFVATPEANDEGMGVDRQKRKSEVSENVSFAFQSCQPF